MTGPDEPAPRAGVLPAMLLLPLLVSCVPVGRHDQGPVSDRVYTVDYGDTLWSIATRYGHPGGYPALARENGIRNPDLIWMGDTLHVRTDDPSLPLAARRSPAPALDACPTQAANRWPSSIAGCAEAACVDTGSGSSVCACNGGPDGGDALVLNRPGRAPERLPVDSETPWWVDPESAPEPERSPGTLVGLRAQLDADPGIETLVGWRTQLNDVGMARGVALLVDDDGAPGATFRADQFGVGSVVRVGGGCGVLATEWEYTDDPDHESGGWYLAGRRYGVEAGALTMGAPLVVMRRLYESFHPTFGAVGTIRVGAPAHDLSAAAAFVRTTEPEVEVPIAARQARTVRSARRVDGALVLDLDGESVPVREDGQLRRLGDLTSGVLYPRGYAPADDASLRGRSGELRTYRYGWGTEFAVLWLR